MKGLSKSRYTAFCQCPKLLWLKIYKLYRHVSNKEMSLATWL